MLSKEEHEGLLKRIMETGGPTEDMEKAIQQLRDDYDEREGTLKKLGEEKDAEPPQEEKSGDRSESVSGSNVDWKAKFDELKARYISRFFGNAEEVKEEIEEDVKADSERGAKTYDELFKEAISD